MKYWLIKSEPSSWSWSDHLQKGTEPWDGVRNHQAANNLRLMKIGDLAFFYHSVKGKEIVGIVEVVKESYPDPSDPTGKFVMVDFKAVRSLEKPVTLQEIKNHPELQTLPLIKQSRLSVMPIEKNHWDIINGLVTTTPK